MNQVECDDDCDELISANQALGYEDDDLDDGFKTILPHDPIICDKQTEVGDCCPKCGNMVYRGGHCFGCGAVWGRSVDTRSKCMSVQSADKPKRLLSLCGLGRALNISNTTMVKWNKDGRIKPDFVCGGIFMFDAERLPELRKMVGQSGGSK